MINALLFSAFLIGFTSMTAQIIFMRELIIIFYGNELSLGVILAAWLFWIGIGSWISGRVAERTRHQVPLFVSCQFLTCLVFPVAIFAVRNLRNILKTMPGEIMGFLPMLASSFAVLAPLCILLGFSFALACRVLANVWEKSPALQDSASRGARSIGQVYILEAIGASVGGLLSSFVLIPYINVYQIIFCVGILNLSAALVLQLAVTRTRSKRVRDIFWRPAMLFFLVTVTFIIAIILAFPLGFVNELENISVKRQWRGLNLVETHNSIYGNIAVTGFEAEQQYSFYENGLLMFTTGDKLTAEQSVHLAMLEHPAPANVLLIGGGVGGALEQILKHPVKRVDYVELDPLIIQTAEKFMPQADVAYLHDERVTIKNIDARFLIKRSISKKQSADHLRYDVVLVNLPDPSTALLNRFYSLEFFQETRQILAPGGILALSVTSSENYLSHEQQAFLHSLYATMKRVFSDNILVMPGANNHLIAQKEISKGTSSLTYDVNILIKRLHERNIKNLYVHEYYLPIRLSPDRVEYITNIISETPKGTRINSDFKPIGYFYNIVLWSSQFRQRSLDVSVFKFFSKLTFWHGLGLIFIFIAIFLGIQIWRILRCSSTEHMLGMPVIIAIGTTGFSEILFQVVVILAFQVLYGYVYYKLSLILASFMIGLVIGGWCINRILHRLKDDLLTYIKTQIAICIYPLILLPIFSFLASFGGRIPPAIHIDTIFAFLPIVAGFIGGFQFPLASKICLAGREDVGRLAGLLYGVDLLGSCLGALLASAILIPIIGIVSTCVLVAILNFGVLILLIVALKGKELRALSLQTFWHFLRKT